MEWGTGDLISIVVGVVFLAGMMLRKRNRNSDRIIALTANGLSLGALLLIVASPLAQLAGFHDNLLELAAREGKLTLWWASVVAIVKLVRDSV